MGWWDGVRDLTIPAGAAAAWLRDQGWPEWAVFMVPGFLGAAALLLLVLGSQIAMVFLERRILGRFQIRIGPNRVGPNGTLQLIADALKGAGKELVIPAGADRTVYLLAPLLGLLPAFLGYAVLTFGPNMAVINMDVGIIYFQAVSSLAAIVMFMAGWASNNKFAVFGGMRAVAQFISYEVPLVLSLITIVLLADSLNTQAIVAAQATVPYWVVAPLALGVFAVASLAEINRTPMDIMEAESEIVAGYHTEYGGMSWLMLYGAEYAHMLSFGAMLNMLFLGGWRMFWLEEIVPPWMVFILKSYLVFFVLVWLRASFPRMRLDQLMSMGWKVLTPVALASIVLTALALLLVPAPQGLVVVGVLQWSGVAVLAYWASRRKRQSKLAARERLGARFPVAAAR